MPKSPWWARLCVWFGAVLMLGSGGVLGGGTLVLGNLSSNVGTDNLLGDSRKSNAGRVSLDGPLNMLLLGTDRRKSWSSWQSDTVIMVHVPKEHDRAYMISFQRDTLVPVPANNEAGCGGTEDKLNAVFSCGGRQAGGKFDVGKAFRATAKTITDVSGVQFDTGATIDFKGFIKVVDVLGGVKLCVETPKGTDSFRSIHGKKRLFKKGCQHLSPEAALDYARQRYQFDSEPGGGDFARMRHQQQLIKAILKQALAKGFDDPSKIPSLVKAAGKSLRLDNSIPLGDMAWALRKITPENMMGIKVPVQAYNANGTSYQKLVEDDANSLFEAVKNEELDSWVLHNPDYVNAM
ncbi:MAG: LCP family protein [Micromonosporaceae bacterium]